MQILTQRPTKRVRRLKERWQEWETLPQMRRKQMRTGDAARTQSQLRSRQRHRLRDYLKGSAKSRLLKRVHMPPWHSIRLRQSRTERAAHPPPVTSKAGRVSQKKEARLVIKEGLPTRRTCVARCPPPVQYPSEVCSIGEPRCRRARRLQRAQLREKKHLAKSAGQTRHRTSATSLTSLLLDSAERRT